MRGHQRVNWVVCWCFTVITLLWMAVLCSVQPSRAVCPSHQGGGLLVNKAALLPVEDPR
ncbi:unnamed protein product, partial [Staurois parvus]